MSNNFNNHNNHNRNNDQRFKNQNNTGTFNHSRDSKPIGTYSPNAEVPEIVKVSEEVEETVILSGSEERISEVPEIIKTSETINLTDYKNDETVTQQVKVITGGKKVSSVNVRSQPDKTQDNVLFEATIDRIFNLVEDGDVWVKVQSIESPFPAGYIMKQFVEKI